MRTIVTVGILIASISCQAGTLYFLPDYIDSLYVLSTDTGAAEFIGTTYTSSNVGLSPSGSESILYGTNWTELVHISTDGSTSTIVGTIRQEGLAYDPENSILYGAINGSLTTHNASTGEVISILAEPVVDVEGLAYGNSLVYGLANSDSRLFAYNPALDAWSVIGDTGIHWELAGLAFDSESNLLYAIGAGFHTSGDANLYMINPFDATTTVVGNTGINEGGGLAFVTTVPIPPAVFLFGSAIVGLRLMSRRKNYE